MAALYNRTGHYILHCGFFFFLSIFSFSSPNLNDRRLDVGKRGLVWQLPNSKFAQNYGFWPPEADIMNTFT